MAQTTDGMSMALAKVETSTDFSDWTDRSGFAGKVTHSGGGRRHGEYFTAGTDTGGLTTGPRDIEQLTFDIVYTEGGSDAWQAIRTAFETAAAVLYVRYSPKGGASTTFMFTTTENQSKVIACPPPVGDFGSGDPVWVSFVVVTATTVKSVVA